jgi:lysophospholipase L1-like esterase
MIRSLRQAVLRIGYCVSGAIILPYAFWVYTQERGSFSRILVTAALLLLCIVTFYLYFATGLSWRPRFSWRSAFFAALLFAFLGLGFGGVLSVALFSWLCELVAYLVRRRGKQLSVHPNAGVALVAVLVMAVFPLLHDMYFHGTQARVWHPDYNKQNVFYGINRDGLRGPIVPVARSQRPRLLFLGDSSPFGYPYRYDESFPFVVGDVLRRRGLDVEIVNGAGIGQSDGEIREQLPFMLRYKPDLVFLMTGIHYHRAGQDYARLQANPAPRRTGWRPVLGVPPMLIELMVFSIATSPVHLILKSRGNAAAERERNLSSFTTLLQATTQEIRASGTRLFLVDYPTPGAERQVQDIVRQVALQTGTEYIPLFDMLGREIKDHLHDRIHPDREGHRLIAEAIAEVAAAALECRAVGCHPSGPLAQRASTQP